MTVSMPFQVARKWMIKAFAFKPFTNYKLSHDRLKLFYILIARLLNPLYVLLELSGIRGFSILICPVSRTYPQRLCTL